MNTNLRICGTIADRLPIYESVLRRLRDGDFQPQIHGFGTVI
jgi:hypothetical protein